MPARSIATFTASATLVIIGVRPMSSGSSCSLIAKPTVSRGSSDGSAVLGRDGREDRRVRADHAVGAAGPHDRDLLDLVGRGALGDQHLAERPVGDDPGVVVDPAVALGLADDRDHAVGVPGRRRRSASRARSRRRRSGSGPCVLRWRRASGLSFRGSVRVRRRCRPSPVIASVEVVEVGDDGARAALLDEPAGRVDLGAHRAAGEVALGGVLPHRRRRRPCRRPRPRACRSAAPRAGRRSR